MNLKKKFMVLLAAGIMAFSVSPFVFAEPEGEVSTDTQQQQMDNSIAANAAAAAAEQTAPTEMEFTNSKYLTKGGAAFWFIFLFVLNGAFSFWVGNRFYRLSRKDNHVNAEIRALRRDIEDKFIKSVGGFGEQEIEIENSNESLAEDSEGIKPAPKQSSIRELSPEEEERFKRWEAAQAKPRSERRVRTEKPAPEAGGDTEEFENVRKLNRKNYKPNREDDNEDAEDLGETRVISAKGNAVKNKTKEILGDIFPFKED